MSIKEIFINQIDSSFKAIKDSLGDESQKQRVLIELHTLKGDLAWLDDFGIIELLAKLSGQISKDHNTESAQTIINEIESRAKLLLPGKGYSLSERVKASINSVNTNFGISISSNIEIDQLDENYDLLMGRILMPLVINAIAHGCDANGNLVVSCKSSNEEISFLVKDSGKKEKKGPERIKTLHGDRLGLDQVRELVYSNGGEFVFNHSESGSEAKGTIPVTKENC